MASIFRASSVFEDSGFHLMARITIHDASNAQQADISSISLQVWDIDRDFQVGATENLTVANVVFDTLQTDARWTADSTGYNFRYTGTAAQVSKGGSTYRYEFKITPASGEVYHIVFDVPTIELKTS
jgi:hypothetical protein